MAKTHLEKPMEGFRVGGALIRLRLPLCGQKDVPEHRVVQDFDDVPPCERCKKCIYCEWAAREKLYSFARIKP